MNKNLLTILFVFLGIVVFGQTKTITGTVTTEQDQGGIPGVSVVIKGTTTGTITDINGSFTIEATEGAILEFSFVGMKPQEVLVGNNTQLSVQLEPDIIGLEEVVAIGYGSSKVKDLTAPIATVSADEITKMASSTAMSAVQGAVAGVQVVEAGAPQGGTSTVRIRGLGSMHGSAPLYVVDGMYFGNINWLNPNDIQDIAVLKDASAAAIYGVRAAGGVILVTTKSGSRNEGVIIQYDGYAGVETTNNILEMSNGKEYSTMMIEAGLSDALTDAIDAFGAAPDKITWQGQEYSYPNNDVDYYDELMKNGMVQNHNLSLRGGSEKADYRVSAGYYSAEGRIKGGHVYERMNVTNKINFQPYKFLKLGSTFTWVQDNNKNGVSPWVAMYNAVPILPMWEENGDYGQRSIYGYTQGSSTANPIVAIDQSDKYGDFNKSNRLMYTAVAEIDFFSNDMLKWRTQVSQEINNGQSRSYAPQYESGVDWSRTESSLTKNFSEYRNLQIDNTLTFQRDFNLHGVTAMAGISTRKVDSRTLKGMALNVPWGENGIEEYLYLYNGSAESQIADDGGYSNRGVSYIGRLQYNYAHKYLLNATFRADGTDKYSETWGYFPSVGIGWVLSEEAFMKEQNLLSYLKLRGSWGQLGNNNVPRESGSQSINFGDSYAHSYLYGGVLEQGYIANVDYNTLKWEVTEEVNVGLDMAFLNDKLSVETDWYRKVTKDAAILTNGIMGGGVTPSLVRNVGEILNTGFEFVVDYKDKVGDLGYSVSANLTTVHNEVLKLADEYINHGSIERRIRTVEGQLVYTFWGKEVIGIYQNQAEIDEHLYATADDAKPKPGYFKYEDVDGDGVITADDDQALGANVPKFTYGGSISLDYKNWDFSTRFYGIHGNKIANGDFNLRSVRSHHTEQNFDKALYENRWTKEGDNTSPVNGLYYPSAEAMTVGNSWNFSRATSFVVEDGSFFKVNNITLGYTFNDILPGSEKGSKVRIRLAADNPFTFFKYNGFDPNVGGQGRDSNTYPLSSNYILGVSITY